MASIYLFSEQGLIVEWNTAMEKITLLKREDVLGRPLRDIYYDFVPDEAKKPEMLKNSSAISLTILRRISLQSQIVFSALTVPVNYSKQRF